MRREPITLYEQDFYAWTQEQVNLLKSNALTKLDIANLIEEVESMGASEKKELTSRLETILMHLLKWKYQPNRQCKSWTLTIKEQRKKLKEHLLDNPSLKNEEAFQTRLLNAYGTAILKAANETNLDEGNFPAVCEWTTEQILDDEFFPN